MKDRREDSGQRDDGYSLPVDKTLPQAEQMSDQSSSDATGLTSSNVKEMPSTKMLMNVRREGVEVSETGMQNREGEDQQIQEDHEESTTSGEEATIDLLLIQKRLQARLGIGASRPSEASVLSLVTDLRSTDEETRAQAAHDLRRRNAQIVGELRKTAITRLRILAIADYHWSVRVAAVRAIGVLEGGAAASSLVISLQQDTHEAVQKAAAQTLGELGTQSPLGPLVLTLHNKETHWSVRAAVVQAIGKLGERALVTHIIGVLDDEDTSVRLEAVRALKKLAGHKAEPYLMKIAHKDDQELVRLEALKLLRELGKAIELPALSDILEIPDMPVMPAEGEVLKEEIRPTLLELHEGETQAIGAMHERADVPVMSPSSSGTCQRKDKKRMFTKTRKIVSEVFFIIKRLGAHKKLPGFLLAALVVPLVGILCLVLGGVQGSSAQVSPRPFSWSISANAEVVPGQQFDILITIVNNGEDWTEKGGYQITCGLKNKPGMKCMGVTSLVIENPTIRRGHSYTVRMPLTAPTSPGRYRIWWIMEQSGQKFGEQSPSVEIDVQWSPAPIISHQVVPHIRSIIILPGTLQEKEKRCVDVDPFCSEAITRH